MSNLSAVPANTDGAQTTTQDPQSSQQSSLQPTNNSSSLTSNGGVPLQSPAVQTIALSSANVSTAPTPVAHGHLNGGLIAMAIILFIAAALLFGSTMTSAKNTTK